MRALWQLFRAGQIERRASDKLKYCGPSVACVGCGNNFAPTLVQPCWRCRIAAEREAEEEVVEADPEIVEALRAYDAGESVSSDWLFEPGCDGKCAHDECICPVDDDDEQDDLVHQISVLLEEERRLKSEALDAIPFRWHGGRASAFAQVLDMLTEQPNRY